MVKKILKWLGIVLGTLLGLLMIAVAIVFMLGSGAMNRSYEIKVASLPVSQDSADVARGAHLTRTLGCFGCHGQDLGGEVMVDDAAFGRIHAPNLTGGEGGIASSYRTEDWVGAIRHGVNPQGKGLLIMPSIEFSHLSDSDVAAIIAFIKQLPPVNRSFDGQMPGPIVYALAAFRDDLYTASIIDHDAPRSAATPGVTVAYGAYLASNCKACHGNDLKGGLQRGEPSWPLSANITTDPVNGIGAWTEADFFRALREKKRPDGSDIHPVAMPPNLGAMTDAELRAIWMYLHSVPEELQANR